MIGGVCAAVAEELRIDVSLVRVAFAVGCVLSFGLAFGVYVLVWALTPFSPTLPSPAARVFDWLDGIFGSSPSSRTDQL